MGLDKNHIMKLAFYSLMQYEGRQFPMRKSHMNAWDEVERQICKEWKQFLIASAHKSKLCNYLLQRVAGEPGKPGFLIKMSDGRHR